MKFLRIFATPQLALLFAALVLAVICGQLGLDFLSLVFFGIFVSAGFLDACVDTAKAVRGNRDY